MERSGIRAFGFLHRRREFAILFARNCDDTVPCTSESSGDTQAQSPAPACHDYITHGDAPVSLSQQQARQGRS